MQVSWHNATYTYDMVLWVLCYGYTGIEYRFQDRVHNIRCTRVHSIICISKEALYIQKLPFDVLNLLFEQHQNFHT